MRAKLNSFALPRAGFLLVGLFAGLFPDISAANPTPTHPSYTFTDLGPPGEAFSSARAINDAGHVAGFSSSPGGGYYAHATVWNGTTRADLRTPVGGFSTANAINNAGEIIGSSSLLPGNPFVAYRATQWNGTGVINLGRPDAERPSVANAINDIGRVAGWAGTGNGGYHATVWDGAKETDLNVLPGWSFSSGQAINNSSQVAGYSSLRVGEDPSITSTYRATLWNDNGATDLGTLGGQYSFASAINDAGQVAGWAELAYPSVYHAALWSNALATDLGTLGGLYSGANAINNAGQVVGWADTAGNVQHAALWNDTTVVDLNRFLDVSTVNAGWVLVAANDINDKGWIVGDAINNRTHQFHGFVLTPIPEPEAYVMFIAGLGLIASVVLRGRREQRARSPGIFRPIAAISSRQLQYQCNGKLNRLPSWTCWPIALIHRNWVCSKPDVSLMKKTCPTQAINKYALLSSSESWSVQQTGLFQFGLLL